MNLLKFLKQKIKTNKMDKAAALKRLDALDKEAMELRKIIEEPKSITDRVGNYDDVLDILHLTKSADDVKVTGFDDAENLVIRNVIKKMRIVKVYNEGWLPKRGERRYYAWYNVSSGFVFDYTDYGDTNAGTTSASRLCLKNTELAEHSGKIFIQYHKNVIGF